MDSKTKSLQDTGEELNIFRDPSPSKKTFFPAGAIAFFILLVLLSLLFWFGIYFLMIERT